MVLTDAPFRHTGDTGFPRSADLLEGRRQECQCEHLGSLFRRPSRSLGPDQQPRCRGMARVQPPRRRPEPVLAPPLRGVSVVPVRPHDDTAGIVLAEVHTIPVVWSGRYEDLGPGIDASIAAGFELHASGGQPNTLCALAAEIPPRHRGRGLARIVLEEMADLGRSFGSGALIAPVRPNWKTRYPLTPIERYVLWLRPDGQPFDPWIRTHVRLGGRIGPALPKAMSITGSVAEWEAWTDMVFPESGAYVFPDGLAPLTIDREGDSGSYWEPNVWLIHQLT